MVSLLAAKGNVKELFDLGENHAGTGDLLTFVEPQEAAVSVFDLAVLRGDGIFEATTIWKGRALSLQNHLKRLSESAHHDDLPSIVIPAFTDAVTELYEHYDGGESGPRIRIVVSRGPSYETGPDVPDDRLIPEVWFLLDGVHADHSLNPLSIISLSRGYTSNAAARAPWLLPGVKTLSYAINEAARREARRQSAQDAVFVTEDGYVLEGPTASYVARFGDTFVTPDPRIGILHGTSQREFFAYALQHGYQVRYEKLPFDTFRQADRIYLTHESTVLPVRSLDGNPIDYDPAEIQVINDAIWAGETEQDALGIQPSGLYE